jgi:hypothetical protein
MKKIRAVLVVGAAISLISCVFALGGGGERPTCAVMSFEGARADDAGLAVLVCSKFAGLLAQSDAYNVIPRLTVNQNLSSNMFDRASYASTREAGVAGGKLLKADYVIVGNVQHTAAGYALEVSLVDTKEGKTINTGRTKSISDMREFTDKAAMDGVQLLVGSIEPAPAKVMAPEVPAVQTAPAPVELPVVEPVKTADQPKPTHGEPVVTEGAVAAPAPPEVVEPPAKPKSDPVPVPARIVAPEPVIDTTAAESQPAAPVKPDSAGNGN